MSDDDMKAELERLRSENAALKKSASDGIRMKVSEKGAVSVYGMGRFQVTLYKEQWLKLLNMSDEIRTFIAENETRLKAKERRGSRPVSREQFEISVRGVTHKPTGATYTSHPGNPLSGTMNKSQLGNVSKRSGDSYSPFEVEAMMEQLWVEYVKANR
jgi:hypothetical protein